MHLDVQDLRNFYYRSTLGRAAQAAIRGRLLDIWPEAKGQTVAGFGFAVPLLRPYLADARRVIGVMPGPQGVMPWPAGMPNVSVLSEETNWPVETGHVDKLVVMHGLETSERPSQLLDECWRVLGPGGKAIFIVPNRAGLWSRSDKTPFGFGRPYTLGQLETQLKIHHFLPENHCSALYLPPSFRRFWLKSGSLIEKAGQRIPTIMAGGVLMVEVSKRVNPPSGNVAKDAPRRPAKVLDGLLKPV
ncbi:class I SAM-dependent methyltransferase [Ruegeria sediminis]|uniref:Class I SAM-dependent methyltransferase n=1 Tax=Ruegeria sediminis TaxID=2583820 RepID=A0ABY2X3E6_9RHOB|nr:class I SAM-dependent methyltransferase [Ruegeria sediminis]TMV09907.1 class I SAM-dependent methyltransferase [Ruegeria sediminis]